MPGTITYPQRYYPKLSEVITIDDLPEFLSFVQDGLNAVFDKIHYKNLQYSKSYRGDAAYYSLDIVTRKPIKLALPFDMALVLNPDMDGNSNISSFPITLEYQWEILAFLKTFSLANFSFSLEDFYQTGLKIFRLSDDQVMAHILNNFVEEPTNGDSKYQSVVDSVNSLYSGTSGYVPIVLPTGQEITAPLLTQLISQHVTDRSVSLVLFVIYIMDANMDITATRLKEFYNVMAPEGIENYIKRLITPQARVTLALSAAIEFPPNLLKPVDENGVVINGQTTKFLFAQAVLYADTQAGIGYQLELAGSLVPTFAEIGSTGLILQIDSLKLDLSKKSNIPEADLDGRPNDFEGVYARAISVTLPPKWFHDNNETYGNSTTTLRLGAYDILIGTGGVSGTILLESVPIVNPGVSFEYYNDKFDFDYPITMFEKDINSNIIIEKTINDYQELKTYLQQFDLNSNAPYPFKFPLSLKPIGLSTSLVFSNVQSYQRYLAGLKDDVLWKKIGGENGFQIGFSSFDITFKQNEIVSSNIRARLEIEGFKKPDGAIAEIDVIGSFESNGDFRLTASTTPPYPTIDFGDIFRLHMKSVELGREGSDFFIGASCDIEFLGMLGGFMEGQVISISSLRIYGNGRIEFHVDGGNLTLPKPIKLNLGPVQVSVTAIHFGSTERQKDGIMRKYNYFGFDGGVNVGIAGLDARGDGIKFYYTVDDGPGKPHDSYLHIQTIYIDLVIPANSDDPTVLIKGWLSIPEPGTSPEYRGGVSLKLKNPRITGKVDMRLAPKYPAFLIDAGIELPNPIALGPVSIYGFRGLLGYRYVAEKEAIGMTSDNTWYEYYTAPQRGVDVNKFNGPENTKEYSNPISLGVGAIIGDTMAMGNIISANAMLLLSLPSMIMVDARMKLLSKRVSFVDDPPFFAFFIIGDNSIEFGFGADYKFPESSGDIIKLYAEIQAGFFFDKPSAWYINIGTEERPIMASLLANLFKLEAYVMLSGKGIRAGARGEFRFERNIGPIGIKFLAYLELGGRISFERPQMGGYFETGVMADVNFVIIRVSISIVLLLAVESPKPFLIYGKFSIAVSIKVLFIKLKVKGQIELKWEFNRDVDQTPISPLTEVPSQLDSLVKGVSMLTGETFDLANLRLPDGSLNIDLTEIRKKVIPLDTYIDIKTSKGLIPGNPVKTLIGGLNNPPDQHTDLIPPERNMKGIELRQVKHQYSIEEIEIMAYSTTSGWQPYNPYRSMYPTDTDPMINTIKAGQWQKKDEQYNAIRLLATTPFSYVEQGEPSWFTPEYYGVGATTLFCQATAKAEHISHFLDKPLGTIYYASRTNFFQSMQASYQIFGDTTYNVNNNNVIVPVGEYGQVTDQTNVFSYAQSLAFSQAVPLIIMLSGPSVQVTLKLTTFRSGFDIEFYAPYVDNNLSFVQYQLVLTKYVTSTQAQQPIVVDIPHDQAVTKIVIRTTGEQFTDSDLFHEVAWVTLEDYQYNINIPSQQYITEDTQATADAINNYLPPIWRPDTSYYVKFTLKDNVDEGDNVGLYEYAYGFHTPGPVGFFHTDEYSPYGPLTHNESDEYPHASLRSYIDYNRSYPNADGDLVSAKPMFYNDTQTGVNLFFTIRYIEKMLTGWEAYGVFPELGGTMKLVIKDPVEDIDIVNPPNLETTEQSIELSPLPIPQTIETWAVDTNPLISPVENQWFNMLPAGCTAVTDPLEPLSYYRKIETRRLKPQKLYTVEVMNFFWGTANIDPEEITPEDKDNYARIIHEYVFQTSRYRNFEDQVHSFYMYAEDGTTVEQEAVYTFEKELDPAILAAALSTIEGTPNAMSQSLEVQFQHPFDRVVEGLFGLPVLQKAVRTEINRIVDTVAEEVVALLIRNPEPFNHPRFPLEVITGTSSQKGMIEVLLANQSGADANYRVLYSKDYAQALIMYAPGAITAMELHFNFVYRIWNGNTYTVADEQQLINVPIN